MGRVIIVASILLFVLAEESVARARVAGLQRHNATTGLHRGLNADKPPATHFRMRDRIESARGGRTSWQRRLNRLDPVGMLPAYDFNEDADCELGSRLRWNGSAWVDIC